MKFLIIALFACFTLTIAQTAHADDNCIFTAYMEKSWVQFGERPWITGFVHNCDSRYFEYHSSNEGHYQNKDTVSCGGGLGGNADTTKEKTIHIRENQYFFYLPQIHSIDFEHRGIYQIELLMAITHKPFGLSH